VRDDDAARSKFILQPVQRQVRRLANPFHVEGGARSATHPSTIFQRNWRSAACELFQSCGMKYQRQRATLQHSKLQGRSYRVSAVSCAMVLAISKFAQKGSLIQGLTTRPRLSNSRLLYATL
jgi:hypothetical protein